MPVTTFRRVNFVIFGQQSTNAFMDCHGDNICVCGGGSKDNETIRHMAIWYPNQRRSVMMGTFRVGLSRSVMIIRNYSYFLDKRCPETQTPANTVVLLPACFAVWAPIQSNPERHSGSVTPDM